MRDSEQSTSPILYTIYIGVQFLKLPPPPFAVLLGRRYHQKIKKLHLRSLKTLMKSSTATSNHVGYAKTDMYRLQKGQPIYFYRRNKSLVMVGGILPTRSLPSKTQKPDVDTIVSHALSNPETSRHTTLKRRTILKTRANLSKRSPLTIRSFSQPSWKRWATQG